MTADKWNPGDVYLMKGDKSAKAISDANGMTTTSINQKIGPINNLFVSNWGGGDGSIVSVSLLVLVLVSVLVLVVVLVQYYH